MKRFTAATTTTAAAVFALAAGIIGSGDIPIAGASARSRTLQVNSKTLVLTGPARPKPGDRLDFYEQDTGGDTGHDYAECTVMNTQGQALCQVEFVLQHGDMGGQAVINVNAATLDSAGPITGGTGNYNGARGTATFTGPATSTRFVFHFVSP